MKTIEINKFKHSAPLEYHTPTPADRLLRQALLKARLDIIYFMTPHPSTANQEAPSWILSDVDLQLFIHKI